MKPDNISDAVGQVDGDIVASAQERRSSGERGYVKPWVRVVAIAVCCCIIFISYWRNNRTETGYAIAEAVYPKMAQYPDEGGMSGGAYDKWQASRQAQLNQPEGYADGIDGFFETSIRQFLSGAGDENRVYSPLNVFMALSMLAEVTDGNSRAQILDALGASDIGALRTQVTAVWNANYCDDGAVTSILANSLWLNRDLTFVNSTMETLATTYYASSYSGKMGSEEFNQTLRDWINEQTGGLLEEQSSDLELNPETVMALAGTIYYQAKWAEQFSKSDTESGTFHSPAGDITCDFMHQSFSKGYCRSGSFTAVMQNLRNSGGMWLILPREGVSIDELIADDDVTDMILPQREWANIEYPIVNLAMPKFDIVSDINLIGGLEALGITDVFDFTISDFSPMTTDIDKVYVEKAEHAARVAVDEDGCIATAYTVMSADGGGMPPEDEVDFVLDRPFMFVITGVDGLPLFAGVVNHP